MAPDDVSWRRPRIAAWASGRLGVRSPSNQGRATTPSLGATASRSMPSQPATRSTARVQLRVAVRGRNRPVASANPATMPPGSMGRRSLTAYATPDVPRLMTGRARVHTEAERGGHVVARADADDHARGQAQLTRRGVPDDPSGLVGRHDRGQQRRIEVDQRRREDRPDRRHPSAVDHQPVPDASPRSVTACPVSRSVR